MLIPALVPAGMRLAVFVPMVVTAFTLQAQTTVVLNQRMMEFIDERRSGRYISLRQTLTLIVTVILSVAGGYWMDLMEGRYEGFIFLFAAAALMGAVEIILLIRTPDSKAYHSSVEKCSLRELMKVPLKNCCFTGFVIAVFNRRYELMPEENRIVYDNFYTAAIGLGFILGPMIGGLIKSGLEKVPAVTEGLAFGNIRLLYIVSTAGILLLQIIYLYTQRKQEVRDVKN